jgi:hypothetical protein
MKDVIQLKLLVKKNTDHLDLIEYILKLTDWYKMKVETQFVFKNSLNGKSVVDVRNISNKIGENVNSLKSLKQDFRKLWLRYYKESNLNMIEDKFDRLILYFQEINENLASGSLQNFNPLIASKWLYFKPNDSIYASKAEFTATFDLEGNIEEALFQLMGNTFVKLFINGKFVDEVFARHSLSLLVDYKRIKLIDVKPYLVSGRNTIQIAAENYNPNNGAGFNLLGRIKSGSIEQIIMSDDSKNAELRWSGREIGSIDWKDVVSKPYPLEITAPNFDIKRTSWIER